MKDADVIVIGGGPAGMAAAYTAAETGASVILIERSKRLGGILPQCIHNGFGSIRYHNDLPGPAYAILERKNIIKSGVKVLTETFATELNTDKQVRIVNSHGEKVLSASAVVLGMGCRERTRAQIRLPGSRPSGVFTAGLLQRLINIEGLMPVRRAVILGSGDIGMIMARRLTLEGAEVAGVYERLPYLTGLRRNYVQCLEDFNIPLTLSTTVTKIIGKGRTEGVEICGVKDGVIDRSSARIVACDTLALSVGLIPENELSRQAGVAIDSLTGGPLTDENFETSVRGIFAAGNVMAIHDLADEVSEEGEKAGRAAAVFALHHTTHKMKIKVRAGNNIRLIFPARISGERDVKFYMRAMLPMEGKVKIKCLSYGKLIAEWTKPYARPAEMISVILKPEHLSELKNKSIYFEIERVEQ